MTREELAELIMKLYFFYDTENINIEINSDGDLKIFVKSFLKFQLQKKFFCGAVKIGDG